MILRTAILGAMALWFTASLAMADEVLYCTDTAGVGFVWDEAGRAVAKPFTEDRFTVKVISDTQRVIARMVGDTAGTSNIYMCRGSPEGQINCDDAAGYRPWAFYKNTYTRAFLAGPPAGPPGSMDQNIWISYGTCARF